MSRSAWIMLALSWGLIGWFALRFFLLVLRTPRRGR